MKQKIKKVTAIVAKKEATPETWRRVWRTFLQAFLGVLAGGLTALVPDFGTPAFRAGLGALVGTAVLVGVTAAMNLEDEVHDGLEGRDQ